MSEFLLSICIPTYNRANTISENVKIYLENLPQNVELVVSDNGSEDNTFEILNEIKDNRFSLHRNKKNKGFSYNLSKAMKNAKGDFILIMSDEDMVDFNNLPQVLSFLNEENTRENISGIVFNSWIEPDEKMTKEDEFLNLIYGRVSYMSGLVYNRLKMEDKDFFPIRSYYPHIGILLKMCCKGNILYSNIPIYNEGKQCESGGGSLSSYMYPQQRLEQLEDDFKMVLNLKNVDKIIKINMLIKIFNNKFKHGLINYELIGRDLSKNINDYDKNVDIDYYIEKFVEKYKQIFYSDVRDNSYFEDILQEILNTISLIRSSRKKFDKLKNEFNYKAILFGKNDYKLYEKFLNLERFNFNVDYICFNSKEIYVYNDLLKIFNNRLGNIFLELKELNMYEYLLFIVSENDDKSIEMLNSLNIKNKEIIYIEDLSLNY